MSRQSVRLTLALFDPSISRLTPAGIRHPQSSLRPLWAALPQSLAAKSSLFLPISPTHLDPTVPDGFAPVFGGAATGRGPFRGASISHFGKNLILYLRKPNYKQSRDSKCFCAIGLGSVRQGWQGVPPCQPSTYLNPHSIHAKDSNIWGQITAQLPGGDEVFFPARPCTPPGASSIPERSRPSATPVPRRRHAGRSS